MHTCPENVMRVLFASTTSVSKWRKRFNNLEQLNAWLEIFELQVQPSITKATRELAQVNINIIDLLQGNYANS